MKIIQSFSILSILVTMASCFSTNSAINLSYCDDTIIFPIDITGCYRIQVMNSYYNIGILKGYAIVLQHQKNNYLEMQFYNDTDKMTNALSILQNGQPLNKLDSLIGDAGIFYGFYNNSQKQYEFTQSYKSISLYDSAGQTFNNGYIFLNRVQGSSNLMAIVKFDSSSTSLSHSDLNYNYYITKQVKDFDVVEFIKISQ